MGQLVHNLIDTYTDIPIVDNDKNLAFTINGSGYYFTYRSATLHIFRYDDDGLHFINTDDPGPWGAGLIGDMVYHSGILFIIYDYAVVPYTFDGYSLTQVGDAYSGGFESNYYSEPYIVAAPNSNYVYFGGPSIYAGYYDGDTVIADVVLSYSGAYFYYPQDIDDNFLYAVQFNTSTEKAMFDVYGYSGDTVLSLKDRINPLSGRGALSDNLVKDNDTGNIFIQTNSSYGPTGTTSYYVEYSVAGDGAVTSVASGLLGYRGYNIASYSSGILEIYYSNRLQQYRTESGIFVPAGPSKVDKTPHYVYAGFGVNNPYVITSYDSIIGTVYLYKMGAYANFTGTPTYGYVDLEVTFTDLSPDAVSWSWDFGDGVGTSTEQHPTYTYTSVGVYDVTLNIVDSDGISGIYKRTNYIDVLDTPTFGLYISGDVTPVTPDVAVTTTRQIQSSSTGDLFLVPKKRKSRLDPIDPNKRRDEVIGSLSGSSPTKTGTGKSGLHNVHGYVPGALKLSKVIREMREHVEFEKFLCRTIKDDDRTKQFKKNTEQHLESRYKFMYNNQAVEEHTAAGKAKRRNADRK